MEFRHLRYFVAVAEELNFRRAAERIGIAQPPLSSQIHDLEAELGVRLFRRVPRGAELTEAGRAFLSEVPAVFECLARAVRLAKRGGLGEVGQLRVGYTGSAAFNEIVPGALREFRRAYPEVELTLAELNSPQLLEQLKQQRLDAVFIRPGQEPPPGTALLSLLSESMVVVVPAEHELSGRYAVELRELAGEPLIMFSRTLGPSLYDEVIGACRGAGFEPIIKQIAPQITSIANLVAVELGVSIVPARTANAAIAGVCYLPIEGIAPVARLGLATRTDDRSVITANFVACVRRAARSMRPAAASPVSAAQL